MVTQNTAQDAIRCYLTGAASDGAEQEYHNLSLGGYRAGDEVHTFGHKIDSAINYVTIDSISDANGIGTGTLTAVTTGSLAWTAPGGTQGTAVAIANGATVILLDGTDSEKFIRVTRTSASDLVGTAAVTLTESYNTAIAGDNITTTENTAGHTSYRCVLFKNGSAAEVTNLKVWISEDAASRFSVGAETPVDSWVTDISGAGDTFAPGGVSFSQPTVVGSALNLGTVAAGGMVALWIRRVVAAASAADPRVPVEISYQFTTGAVDYENNVLAGFYRVAKANTATYNLYRGTDAEPTYGAAYETFTTLPHTTAAQAVSHVYYYVLRCTNEHGVETQNVYSDDDNDTLSWKIELDAAGAEVAVSPSDPENIVVVAGAALTVDVSAVYEYEADGDDAADTWLIYFTDDGSTPDPDNDTPNEVTMGKADGFAKLKYNLDESFDEGDTVKVLVRTQRSSDDGESTNTTVSSVTATALGSTNEVEEGCSWRTGPSDVVTTVVWSHDASNYITRDSDTGTFKFYIADTLVAALTASRRLYLKGNLIQKPYSIDIVTINGGILRIRGGVLTFNVFDGGTNTYQVADLDGSGNLTINKATIDPGFPEAGTQTDYIEWNTSNTSIDFSPDLVTVVLRVDFSVSGVHLGELTCASVRTEAFG